MRTQKKEPIKLPIRVWSVVAAMIANHSEARPIGANCSMIVKGGDKWSITPDIMGRCIRVVNNGNLEHANLLEQRLANKWRERGQIAPAFAPAMAAKKPEEVKAAIAAAEVGMDEKYAAIDEVIAAIQADLAEATTITRIDVPLHGWADVAIEAPDA